MSKSVLYMSMSLDGYIAGPNDQPGNPGGDDFMRLHEWYGFAADAGPTEETIDSAEMGKHFLDEIKETGAVLSGRNTVEQTDHWGGDHHDGVANLCPQSPAAGAVGRQVSIGDLCNGWDRQRYGAGEGRRR